MLELFEYLERNTSCKGSYSITFNEHKEYYTGDVKEYYFEIFSNDELIGIDFSKNIYRLAWFKDTPVGHYDFIANSVTSLFTQVLEVIRNETSKAFK